MTRFLKPLKAFVVFGMLSTSVFAQTKTQLNALYEQVSEASGYVVRYGQDVRAIETYYGAGNVSSPERLDRLTKLNMDYLANLQKLPFDDFSVHGQVDYVLLKRKIDLHLEALEQEKATYQKIQSYLPFASTIYDFEKGRRRGMTVSGEDIAGKLHAASLQVSEMAEKLSKDSSMDSDLAGYLASTLEDLRRRLKSGFDFYHGYDPMFTWWVPAPYKDLDERLAKMSQSARSKVVMKVFNDGSNIGGPQIGRAALTKQLLDEMIPYSPDELLKLAEQEFAWCEAELLKASREMGFGDDWRAAQEKVKNSYVKPGLQPEAVIKLNQDALDFINARKLLTMPDLSHETWGMVMMSPEQQLVSPFFLGGRNIMIAYPTDKMSHDRKLMSMRGNNPYFSRGTVQHELVPGHHLQYFMNSRYKNYRQNAFNTPFWTEGWTL